jgi:hypothetical protein
MYHLMLFGHITGAIVLSCAVMLEIVGVAQLARATDCGEVRTALFAVKLVGTLAPIGALLLVLFGVGMIGHGGDIPAGAPKELSWGTGWLIATYILFAIMMGAGPGVNGKRLEKLKMLADGSAPGPITAEMAAIRSDPLLAFTVALGPCTILAVLFLMTNKPNGVGSSITAVVAAAVAFALSRLWLARVAVPAPQAA